MNELNSKIVEKNIKINKEMVQKYKQNLYLQLGMMVIAIGLSSYNIALFHLVNHAYMLYKCMLNSAICWKSLFCIAV